MFHVCAIGFAWHYAEMASHKNYRVNLNQVCASQSNWKEMRYKDL